MRGIKVDISDLIKQMDDDIINGGRSLEEEYRKVKIFLKIEKDNNNELKFSGAAIDFELKGKHAREVLTRISYSVKQTIIQTWSAGSILDMYERPDQPTSYANIFINGIDYPTPIKWLAVRNHEVSPQTPIFVYLKLPDEINNFMSCPDKVKAEAVPMDRLVDFLETLSRLFCTENCEYNPFSSKRISPQMRSEVHNVIKRIYKGNFDKSHDLPRRSRMIILEEAENKQPVSILLLHPIGGGISDLVTSEYGFFNGEGECACTISNTMLYQIPMNENTDDPGCIIVTVSPSEFAISKQARYSFKSNKKSNMYEFHVGQPSIIN